MPRLALANNLYRGSLPIEFQDLTWVEEMVCALYRTTAHVTRLFKSTDPAVPKIMHGNTCAHEMNVVSTASVLPRTAADVNDALSVVFIGPEKFESQKLHSIFRVRKHKIQAWLMFLKQHNRLFQNIPIDLTRLSEFPDDGALPGVADHLIEDHQQRSTRSRYSSW
ncbi:hypothetical protein BJ138DRAFT_1138568 [Hygrophoropsis aurantiaca]|uniref:Uncharacterized protein n=1 Tax=Hygrophoropsis aurantiaca TaxID=72124 RepID=A0ACB7ZTX4_9AGAM|nr:hypothetical protein BJ138DRAFT_1138568 [Hygrophoropsis aurantiaca]